MKIEEAPNIKVLDCTLRDGGYYTDWHFSTELVSEYLNKISLSGIDIVEIGFRSPKKDRFYGPYAYCSDSFLQGLALPSSLTIGVMINAKDYIADNDNEQLDTDFADRKDSLVSLVRIASHFHEVDKLDNVINRLRGKGYRVIVNLMQAGGKKTEEIISAITPLAKHELDAIYFADSFGNMNEREIAETITAIKTKWSGEIGIHAHNNMSNALKNCMHSLEHGVSYLDATILGMGRGAGNTQTEYLLLELSKRGEVFHPEAVFPLVLKQFKVLRDRYEWGPGLLYYLSAKYNIHPTYIQEILQTENATTDVINALQNLKNENATSYSNDRLTNALKLQLKDSEGTWDPKSLFKGRDVLIVGSGPSVAEHREAIERYVDIKKPVVISLNINSNIHYSRIDAYAACHPIKLFSDSKKYKYLKRPLMMPFYSINDDLQKKFSDLNILNYGMKVTAERFQFKEFSCEIPCSLVLAYVFAAVTSGRACRVLVAGLDGYQLGDKRQAEMEQMLERYHCSSSKQVISVTPTSYTLDQSSIYCDSL